MLNKKRGTVPSRPIAPPPPPSGKQSSSSSSFSVIGPDIEISGNLTAERDLHFDGKIEGDVVCASLVQGASSVIAGAVRADKARLAGRIEGSVEAGDLVIEGSAQIKGDVYYDQISVSPGAEVEGQLRKKAAVKQNRSTDQGQQAPLLRDVVNKPAGSGQFPEAAE